MLRFTLPLLFALAASATRADELQDLREAVAMPFPAGFAVLAQPRSDAEVVQTVPGPTEANVRATLRTSSGEVFHLSDWSWERRLRGESYFWIQPLGQAEPDLMLTERLYERVFRHGYETVAEPDPAAPPLAVVEEPTLLTVAAEAQGGRDIHFLAPEQNERRLRGEPAVWLRDRMPPARPELLPRMRELAEEHELPFGIEDYVRRPWQFSADLYPLDPAASREALREFGVEVDLPWMASQYEDREFPFAWLREVARLLGEQGALDRAAAALRAQTPRHEKALALFLRSEEAEMMPGYVRDNLQFDRRFLAILEAERGDFAEVERLLLPLLEGWDAEDQGLIASGPRLNTLREVARARWTTGRDEAAREATRSWLAGYSRDLALSLLHPEYTAASERFTEFDSDFEAVGDYFELLGAVTDAEIAAEIVVGLKGLRLAVAAAGQIRGAASRDPGAAPLLEELLRTEEELRRLALEGEAPDPVLAARLPTLQAELAARRLAGTALDLASDSRWAALDAEIAQRSAAGELSWDLDELIRRRDLVAAEHLIEEGGFFVGPQGVREALAEDEILVDFFRVPPATLGDEARYGAVLIAAEGPAALVDVGSGTRVDAAVARYRDLMLGQGEHRDLSREELAAATEEAVRSAYDAVLAPLSPRLEQWRRVVFCPEGALAFLPLDLLGPDRDSVAHRRWEIGYVNAARDLLRRGPAGRPPSRSALLLGDPDYAAEALGAPPADSGSPVPRSLSEPERAGLVSAARGIELTPLPGTLEEVETLRPKLAAAGFEVEVLAGLSASEPTLRETVRSPEILHLATHGFFLDRLPVPGEEAASSAPRSAMLQAGLALAGAQGTLDAWRQGRVPDLGADGILFAAEVAQLDLSGTELAVLSACDTALGETLSGEGVEGLRHALTLAGARNALITLWPVDDASTVTQMRRFYSRWLEGAPPGQALAEEKRGLFEEIAEGVDLHMAHLIAGPFVLTRTGRAVAEP